ncbi:TolC family outer membrane protein [Nisaea denitrificans]|uniref:TolC family outer membrane protein n=1 Tax=Nisaea denitrificans TaxID=390877 RepID=UPI00042333ED|nr:TolC family outer membrane protein [Nisaea denitrificans]
MGTLFNTENLYASGVRRLVPHLRLCLASTGKHILSIPILRGAHIGILLSMALLPGHGSAQTLEEAFALAYKTNPGLISARALLRQTNELAPQARGGWRPQVSFNGTAGYTDVKQSSRGRTVNDDNYNNRTLSLEATQPLYTFGRVEARVDAADATIESQRAQLFQTEQNTFVSTATAYLTVIREGATLDLQRNNLSRLRQQLEATRARFEVEDLTRTDVAQAQASVASAEADVASAEASLAQARVSFARVIGQSPEELTVPDLPSGLPETRDEAIKIAVGGSFSLLGAKFSEAAAARQLEAAKADLLPTVNLVTSLNHSEDSSINENESWNAAVSVRLTVPLYQSGITYSKAREAQENLRRLRFSAIDQERVASEGAANAYEALQGSYSQIDALQAQIDAAAIALEGVQSEATVGARTVIDVLDAEQALLDARVRLVRARYDVLVSSYSLLSAIGRLTAQDLELPVDYYDYDQHYREVRTRWLGTETSDPGYFRD